ncbi:mitogen-activated protein kinase kinase kinase [Dispira parvispora]|uniref:Mitogen-activated protein kinase kinase kinase n=1 Tax=Dispira parvispora TaxID=1520584 RepID=A0A9W8E3I3_9FUNG|nr:mitogen-activated protein kinase kinase kinase [Dispira parvispora]
MSNVLQWLKESGFAHYAPAFYSHKIYGEAFVRLSQDKLRQMGIPTLHDRTRLLGAVRWVTSNGAGSGMYLPRAHSTHTTTPALGVQIPERPPVPGFADPEGQWDASNPNMQEAYSGTHSPKLSAFLQNKPLPDIPGGPARSRQGSCSSAPISPLSINSQGRGADASLTLPESQVGLRERDSWGTTKGAVPPPPSITRAGTFNTSPHIAPHLANHTGRGGPKSAPLHHHPALGPPTSTDITKDSPLPTLPFVTYHQYGKGLAKVQYDAPPDALGHRKRSAPQNTLPPPDPTSPSQAKHLANTSAYISLSSDHLPLRTSEAGPTPVANVPAAAAPSPFYSPHGPVPNSGSTGRPALPDDLSLFPRSSSLNYTQAGDYHHVNPVGGPGDPSGVMVPLRESSVGQTKPSRQSPLRTTPQGYPLNTHPNQTVAIRSRGAVPNAPTHPYNTWGSRGDQREAYLKAVKEGALPPGQGQGSNKFFNTLFKPFHSSRRKSIYGAIGKEGAESNRSLPSNGGSGGTPVGQHAGSGNACGGVTAARLFSVQVRLESELRFATVDIASVSNGAAIRERLCHVIGVDPNSDLYTIWTEPPLAQEQLPTDPMGEGPLSDDEIWTFSQRGQHMDAPSVRFVVSMTRTPIHAPPASPLPPSVGKQAVHVAHHYQRMHQPHASPVVGESREYHRTSPALGYSSSGTSLRLSDPPAVYWTDEMAAQNKAGGNGQHHWEGLPPFAPPPQRNSGGGSGPSSHGGDPNRLSDYGSDTSDTGAVVGFEQSGRWDYLAAANKPEDPVSLSELSMQELQRMATRPHPRQGTYPLTRPPSYAYRSSRSSLSNSSPTGRSPPPSAIFNPNDRLSTSSISSVHSLRDSGHGSLVSHPPADDLKSPRLNASVRHSSGARRSAVVLTIDTTVSTQGKESTSGRIPYHRTSSNLSSPHGTLLSGGQQTASHPSSPAYKPTKPSPGIRPDDSSTNTKRESPMSPRAWNMLFPNQHVMPSELPSGISGKASAHATELWHGASSSSTTNANAASSPVISGKPTPPASSSSQTPAGTTNSATPQYLDLWGPPLPSVSASSSAATLAKSTELWSQPIVPAGEKAESSGASSRAAIEAAFNRARFEAASRGASPITNSPNPASPATSLLSPGPPAQMDTSEADSTGGRKLTAGTAQKESEVPDQVSPTETSAPSFNNDTSASPVEAQKRSPITPSRPSLDSTSSRCSVYYDATDMIAQIDQALENSNPYDATPHAPPPMPSGLPAKLAQGMKLAPKSVNALKQPWESRHSRSTSASSIPTPQEVVSEFPSGHSPNGSFGSRARARARTGVILTPDQVNRLFAQEGDKHWNNTPERPLSRKSTTTDRPLVSCKSLSRRPTTASQKPVDNNWESTTGESWTQRPTTDLMSKNLDVFFPHHDLDKPTVQPLDIALVPETESEVEKHPTLGEVEQEIALSTTVAEPPEIVPPSTETSSLPGNKTDSVSGEETERPVAPPLSRLNSTSYKLTARPSTRRNKQNVRRIVQDAQRRRHFIEQHFIQRQTSVQRSSAAQDSGGKSQRPSTPPPAAMVTATPRIYGQPMSSTTSLDSVSTASTGASAVITVPDPGGRPKSKLVSIPLPPVGTPPHVDDVATPPVLPGLLRRKSTRLWGAKITEVEPGQTPDNKSSTNGEKASPTPQEESAAAQSWETPDVAPSTSSAEESISDKARYRRTLEPLIQVVGHQAANKHTVNMEWMKGKMIGQGSFGKVFLAINRSTGEFMAVKQIELPQAKSEIVDKRQRAMIKALYDETEILKDLDDEHIVSYLGFQVTRLTMNIFLEYVAGGSIASLIKQHGPLAEPVMQSFCYQTLCGLDYIHSCNLLHRDIKGANILVDENGVCKISDFGISKRNDYQFAYDNNSRMSVQGTFFWMAPEVVREEGYSAKVDIWSFGCLVLEMWSGRRPWISLNEIQAVYKLRSDIAPPLPDEIVPECADLIKTCFRPRPEDRPRAVELLKHPFCQVDPGFNYLDYYDPPEAVDEYAEEDFRPLD